MKARPKGRKGEQEAREEWTARLQRFANARTAKQKQAAIEPALKINPGGALRDMLLAWGYSASARGRKPKGAKTNGQDKTARERLEETLDSLFGKKPSPVRSLYAKLAGRADITVKDACRIVAALVATWPAPLKDASSTQALDEMRQRLELFGSNFVRELLADLSAERSREWTSQDLDERVFRLADEIRVGVTQFIQESGKSEGALIVAGSKSILLGDDPVYVIKQFHNLTSQFVSGGSAGIIVFVIDGAIFEAGRSAFDLIYNLGILSISMTAFALLPIDYNYRDMVKTYQVDWSRWRDFNRRCCVVVRRPPLIDPKTGLLLKRENIDSFVSSWRPKQEFAHLDELKGFVRFDASHVLPRNYPSEWKDDDLLGRDLYWDVIVRPDPDEPEGLGVNYFTPSQKIANMHAPFEKKPQRDESKGNLKSTRRSVEEDYFYVTKRDSPNLYYDEAQRKIYLSARGRLGLDKGEDHTKNLNAASALRQMGFEVLPISLMLSLFPRALHFSATEVEHQVL